ncbi:hypothetical protein [Frigidibacter sp. SD6-1]|uniref:hypothetical protein n=1 Tax=Frigidibacter sp. SD6-1 TaxID=3032581 RepID=UPI0024DF6378|nr:hypothetical protein [Frigidibacter sp. SD6-1]
MINLIGHNGGPTLEGGASWRAHCWRTARARLLPVLPVEVVRLRVKRAAELGLDYKTYAGVRATTGRDLLAFLFSSNALALSVAQPVLPPERAGKLDQITACGRIALANPPLTPEAVRNAACMIDAAHAAPALLAPEREVRARLRAALGHLPADAVLLIGDHALERDWCAAGRLAGYLSAERFFTAPTAR